MSAMIIPSPGHPHLTYCTNIHSGETWEEVRRNLERYVLQVKAQISPAHPFGIGLRLSSQAAEDLSKPDTLEAFSDFLRVHGLYVFTINGFPYGPFHGQSVKEEVYRPDWLDERRLIYTNQLARLLAYLLPSGPVNMEGSISTVPGAFKPRVTQEADIVCMIEFLLRHLAMLHHIHESTGHVISLALEPEPCCFFETVAETIAFFQSRLFSRRVVKRFSSMTGLAHGESEVFLRRHAAVCFDACHMAVEFEDPKVSLRAFEAAGIRIGKIQVSAGLRVLFNGDRREQLTSLARFSDEVYLHQVIERRNGGLTRYADLPHALQSDVGEDAESAEWRIHFHVPLFRERLGLFTNTQDFLRTLLKILRCEAISKHLEIETYTWSVLPEEYRSEDIVTSVVREMEWVLARLHRPGN